MYFIANYMRKVLPICGKGLYMEEQTNGLKPQLHSDRKMAGEAPDE